MTAYRVRFIHTRHRTTFEVTVLAASEAHAVDAGWVIVRGRIETPEEWAHQTTEKIDSEQSAAS